jgi:hypothetical protein
MSNTRIKRIADCIGCFWNGADVREGRCYTCTRTDSKPMVRDSVTEEMVPAEKKDMYMTNIPTKVKPLFATEARQRR